ncbi:MAG: hypothetical protein JJV94_06190 [Sulfurospirillum sp.]|nr:hypothetical protein [Sulfurospirillum sp.]
MEDKSLIEHMKELLKKEPKYVDKHGALFMSQIFEDIDKIDTELIKLLINDKKAKENFFEKIEDIYVLNNQNYSVLGGMVFGEG